MKDIVLKTKTLSSVIHCGEGTFEKYAPTLRERQIFMVTDSNVFALYRYKIWETFGNNFPIKILPAGENSKTPKYLLEILGEMLKCGMQRNCTVIAFGGGVVGDIAGLAAALYMRGVHLVQIPTTLLSQVDSSVGGKTAVDLGNVKNVVGTFYQPEEVIADPEFLETLPKREIRCGLGEIVKYGALNKDIYLQLLNNIVSLEKFAFSEELIASCIEHKVKVVTADEHDLGERKSLNLGHTTGHAFELYYRKKSHGEFVLIGMFYELYIAKKLGICGGGYAENLKKLIRAAIGKLPVYSDVDKAAEYAAFDKKNAGNTVSVILPESEDVWKEVKLPPAEYIDYLKECTAFISESK